MLTTVWIGLAGALLMFAGDMLLYYTPKDFSYGPKSSTEKRLNAIIDVMKSLPARRVMVGGMIGPVSAFLYCVGFYHIVLMTNEQSHTLAMAAFLLSCFGIITGGAYHSHCAYLGLLGDNRDRAALEKVMRYFQKLPLIFYIGEGIGFVLLAFLIVTGNTVLPRWLLKQIIRSESGQLSALKQVTCSAQTHRNPGRKHFRQKRNGLLNAMKPEKIVLIRNFNF